MKCPRGWILCQNEEGYTVPYFVKVRATDVLTSNSISDKFGLAKVLPSDLDTGNVTILPAGQTYFLGLKGWKIWLNNNETVKMMKRIPIDKSTSNIREHNIIDVKVDLPFTMLRNELFSINPMKYFSSFDLIQSFVNIQEGGVIGENTDRMRDFYIELHTISMLPDNFLDQTDVAGSYMNVVVEGMIDLGKYSHMDELGQIGAPWDPSASSNIITPNNVYSKGEVNNMLQQMRIDIQNGNLIGPRDIVDVVDNVTDSVVLPKGIVFDVETAEEIAAQQTVNQQSENEAPKKAVVANLSEGDELSQKQDEEEILSLDISNINFGGSDDTE